MVVLSATICFLLLQVGAIAEEDPQVIILLADNGYNTSGDIFRLNIHHMNISRIPVKVESPQALDYDHTNEMIYFTDVHTKQIRRCDINGANDVEVARLNSTSSPEGLALDTNTRQVFYTDNGNNLIGKVDMDTLVRAVIVNTGLDQPRGIVAYNKNRRLYWVDYGTNPKLETSDYDGGQRSIVVFSGITDPVEIVIDEQAGRLYWSEASGVVVSVEVNGLNRRKEFSGENWMPSHMSIFNGFMYLTHFHDSYLAAVPLNHVEDNAKLQSTFFKRPRGIYVFSPNFEVNVSCPDGKYGRDCTTCGPCKYDSVCEKTTGICFRGCQPGYTADRCNEECPPRTFGADCLETCNCRGTDSCDSQSGICPNGCQSGWKGDKCNIEETGPPVGLIVGATLGAIVLVIVIVVVVVCVLKRKRVQKEENENEVHVYTTLDKGSKNPAFGNNANVY